MAAAAATDIAGLVITAFIVIVVLALVLSGVKILKEWERAPMLTLGRYRGLKGPGLIYVPPFVSKIPFIISTRLQVAAFKTEQTLTRDNVPVNVDAVMYFQPVDVQKSVLNAENYNNATQLAAQTTLRETIGGVSFDDLLYEREKIGASARAIIDSKTEAWGGEGDSSGNQRYRNTPFASGSDVKAGSSREGKTSKSHARRS